MADFEDLILRDTRANQPAAGIAGRLYYVTDEKVWERDSGVAWEDATSGTGLGYFNVTDYGATGDGTTDDTSAVQDAIDACAAAGGGTVFFPEGIYKIAGALQDTAGANAQLVLPDVDATTDQQIAIKFKGAFPQYPNASVIQTVQVPINGSIIKGTLNSGTDGNLLGCVGTGANAPFSQIMLYIEDLTFRMPNNPVLTCLDLENVKCADLRDVIIDTGNYSMLTTTEPSTTASYGVKLPANTNGAVTNVDRLTVLNFYTGIKLAEHANVDFTQVQGCKYAAEIPSSSHALYIKRFLAQHNESVLRFTGGTSRIIIEELAIEHYNTGVAGAKWNEPIYDIDDASNYGIGSVRFLVGKAGIGIDNSAWVVNGAKNLSAVNIRPGQIALLDWGAPSGTGTHTFSNILPFYKKIIVEYVAKSSYTTNGSVAVLIALNADTTDSHYRSTRQTASGTNTTAVTGEETRKIGTIAASHASTPANSPGSGIIEIVQPFNTTFNKIAIARSGARIDAGATFEMHLQESRLEWENTAAITSLTLSLENGNYVSGSEIRLYGVT